MMWETHANLSAVLRAAASHCPRLSLTFLTRF